MLCTMHNSVYGISVAAIAEMFLYSLVQKDPEKDFPDDSDAGDAHGSHSGVADADAIELVEGSGDAGESPAHHEDEEDGDQSQRDRTP